MKTPANVRLHLVTVTHCYPAHGGGIELVAERLVAELAALGVTVAWVSSDTDPPPRPEDRQVSVPIPTFNLVERLTQLPYPIWSPFAIPRLWKAITDADVVHVHEHLYVGSMLAVAIARLRGRPVIITQHMGALGLGNRALTALYEAAARLLGWIIFPAASRAVFISANVCRFFHQESRRHTRLIYNGIDTKRFGVVPAEQRQSVRASLGLPSDRRIILFVGRFVRKKGLHIVESLTRRFPEVLWIFVGSGPEDPSKWSYTNVQVPGRIEHERLAAFYHAADLLLLPSYGEGFPLVVQEALACGLGVLSTTEVGTACPAAREMIRTQPTPRGRVDITGWETALRATLLDEAYLAARDSRSRKARELWSWERCTSEYLSLFDEVMTPGR